MIQLHSEPLQSDTQALILETNTITNQGIIIAVIIVALWAISLISLLRLNLDQIPAPAIALAMLWQTFLYTGLFITGHDAMHGLVYPANLKLNHGIGKVTVFIFGLFLYQTLLKKHQLHHRYPGTKKDPDYYDYPEQNVLIWYGNFMKSYWTWQQLLGFFLIFNLLKYGCQITALNLFLFWVLPPLLSSFQLFYFGTFLPHRKLEEEHTNQHNARTIAFPLFWSFLSCYHFGYHHEHHEFPNVPWWQLPLVYQSNKNYS